MKHTPATYLLAALLLAAAAQPARALARHAGQQAGDTDALMRLYETGPHLGSVEQALVGIEVTTESADGAVRQTRHGNGFMLRCDGFVLAPSSLFGAGVKVAGQVEAGRQTITVVLHPGTAQEKRVSALPPHFMPPSVGYTAIKLDRVHTPALQTLLPDALRPGDAVQVWAALWDAAAHRFLPPARHDATLAAPTANPDAPPRPGEVALVSKLDGLPEGAVVIGAGGQGIGLATTASPDRFVAFSVLNDVTNAVTPLPPQPPSAPEQAGALPNQPADDMVAVPGGPVVMPAAVLRDQPDMEGTRVACVAPFQIDRTEVTNRQYLEFWNTLPEDQRRRLDFRSRYYPEGWARTGQPFPASVADLPVVGVPYLGAYTYAKAHGKRLPTPYEWCLAAFGPKGDHSVEWMQKYVQDRQRVWVRIREVHRQFVATNPTLQQDALKPFLLDLPWISSDPGLQPAARWSKQACQNAVDELWQVWLDPPCLLPAGSRDYDVSPFGARDMVMNAEELVQWNPGGPLPARARFMEVAWLPEQDRRQNVFHVRSLDDTGKGGHWPLMSRLIRRTLLTPGPEVLAMLGSVNELELMMEPLAGWEVRLAQGGDVTEAPPISSLPNPLHSLYGLELYAGQPPHFREELGRPLPLEPTERGLNSGAQLTFLLPTGFRCAR